MDLIKIEDGVEVKPFDARAAEIEHAEKLALTQGQPWVVYYNPRTGWFRSYNVRYLGRLRKSGLLPEGKIVYVARKPVSRQKA